jgi:hypothetical protein
MIEVLQQALARIEQLTQQLTPEEQAEAAERLSELADELVQERRWKESLHDPAMLPGLEALIERAYASDAKGLSHPMEDILLEE